MKKVLFFILNLVIFTNCVYALEEPNLYSKDYVLFDTTDQKIIYEKNINERTNIASLTKIMTTITAIEKISNLEDKVTITEEMLSNIKFDASLAGLKVGDILSYKDLLYASILPSGADATQALAYSLSGNVPKFVKDMNTLAKKIGMSNSNFVNVTGLDIDNHYSTISDLLTMLRYALNNETFYTIYKTKEYTLSNGKTVYATVSKYNKLMNLDISRIIGSKTGYTNNAGLCISSIFESNGHRFIFISTNAEFIFGNYYNLKDNLNIIKFMDQNYNNQILVKKNEEVASIPTYLSNIKTYKIQATDNIQEYLPNDYNKDEVKVTYEGKNKISFLDNNKKIGTIKIMYQNNILKEENVIVNNLKINIFVVIIIAIIIFIILIRIFKRLFKSKTKY